MEPTGANPGRPLVLLTVKQVAEILQWNPFTVIKKAEKGILPAFKLGREWRFKQEDLVAWIDRQKNLSSPTSENP